MSSKLRAGRKQLAPEKVASKGKSVGMTVEKKKPAVIARGRKIGQIKRPDNRKQNEGEKILTQPINPRTSLATHAYNISLDKVERLPSAESRIVYTIPITYSSIEAFSYGVICEALMRGYNQTGQGSDDHFQAWLYLTSIITSAVQNTTSPSVSVPHWLSLYLQSLIPKSIRRGNGGVSFRFELTGAKNSTPIVPIDSSYGINSSLGTYNTSSSQTINGMWKTVDNSAIPNVAIQERSWTTLLQFLNGSAPTSGPLKHMHKIVPATSPNSMTKDPSAFANCVPLMGSGFGCGALQSSAGLEVPINSPNMANNSSDSAQAYNNGRFPVHSANVGADNCFKAVWLSSWASESQLQMKNPPRVKSYDFNEFLDTCARWLQLASEAALKTTIAEIGVQVGGIGLAKYTCPITFQEFKLLLRATLMEAFGASQVATQSIVPVSNSTGTDNIFIPFCAGFGTGGYTQNISMQLPKAIVENIRAATMIIHNGSKKGWKNATYWLPQLGAYINDALDGHDYDNTVIDDETTINVPMFADDTGEIPIRMHDGRAGNNYVVINDPAPLAKLCATFNDWVKEIVINTTAGMDAVGNDGGINVLRCVGTTRYWDTISTGEDLIIKKKVDRKQLSGSGNSGKTTTLTSKESDFSARSQKRFKRVVSANNYYNTRGVNALSSFDAINADVYTTFMSNMITPICRLTTGAQSQTARVSLQKHQAMTGETTFLTLFETNEENTLGSSHQILAGHCVKTPNGGTTALELWFDEMAKQGRGGILGNIVGGLYHAGGPIVDQLAGMIPY